MLKMLKRMFLADVYRDAKINKQTKILTREVS